MDTYLCVLIVCVCVCVCVCTSGDVLFFSVGAVFCSVVNHLSVAEFLFINKKTISLFIYDNMFIYKISLYK